MYHTYACGTAEVQPVVSMWYKNTTENTTGMKMYHTYSCGTAEVQPVVSMWYKNTTGNTTEKNYTTKLPYGSVVHGIYIVV